MSEKQKVPEEMEKIKELVNEGRIDDSVEVIANYLERSDEENYIDRLENVIETLLSLHGGRTVIRFLIEHDIINIPSLLENLSKRDSLLRYSFLLLLKSMCENESDLFLPYAENLLENEDPNVKEALLQLIVFMAGGEKEIADKSLIKLIGSKLTDEKEFVTEKATQALVALGKQTPSLMTKTLSNYAKENSENEDLRENIDDVLKSIVSIEKIEEIVEEDKTEMEEKPSTEEVSEKINEEQEEIGKKKVEKKEKQEQKEEKEKDIKKTEEELKQEEDKILDKELELKKKELELKKKRLELEAKEKEIEEQEIKEREKALKKKQELIEKEKELSQVELELKQKSLEDKEKKIKEQEAKRIQDQIKKLEEEYEDEL
ncbi:MAG: hypothetical protein BAJALOKI2v1_10066 [Promethearchaeota archaeon]|nr:MAG: hypothetical protein BAJALOKI2v1_10066 [Candidatus Lokiarchaeota archaeon]